MVDHPRAVRRMAGHGPLDRGHPSVFGTGILPDLLGDERQLARGAEAGGFELCGAEGEVGGVISILPLNSPNADFSLNLPSRLFFRRNVCNAIENLVQINRRFHFMFLN